MKRKPMKRERAYVVVLCEGKRSSWVQSTRAAAEALVEAGDGVDAVSEAREFSGSYTRADGARVSMTPEEAEALWKSVDEAKADRIERMPDEQAALNAMMDAYIRLKELGWNDAIYCPKDGSVFEVVEIGSTGIHDCYYQGKWPDGRWWIVDGDTWPSRPALYRIKKGGEKNAASV